jgi:hypothetical protein
VEVPPLQAWIVADSMAGGTRRVRLVLRSAIGAEMIQLRPGEGGETRVLAVNGREVPVQEPPTLVEHWGDPAPAVVVDLAVPQGATLDVDVVELLGAEHFRRPPSLAPNITWMSDRALVRTPASALAIQYGEPPFAAGDTALGGVPVPPEPDTAAADTAGVSAPDTSGVAAPDSSGGAAPPDTAGASPDTTGMATDSSAAVPDTGRAAPDAGAAPPDTTRTPSSGGVR